MSDQLRELITKWRERAEASREHGLFIGPHAIAECAYELEAVLVSALAPLVAATTTIIEIEHVHRIVWLSCGHRFQVVSMGNLRCNVGDRWPCGLCDEGVSALAPLGEPTLKPQAVDALKEAVETARHYYMLFHDDRWKARLEKWEAAISALAALPGATQPKGSFGYCAICYHPLDKCSHCDSPAARPDTEAPAPCWICRNEPFGSTQERERCQIHGLKASEATAPAKPVSHLLTGLNSHDWDEAGQCRRCCVIQGEPDDDVDCPLPAQPSLDRHTLERAIEVLQRNLAPPLASAVRLLEQLRDQERA